MIKNEPIPWNFWANTNKQREINASIAIKAQCKCGAAKFSITGAPISITMCHCESCRRRKHGRKNEDFDPFEEDEPSSEASNSGCSQRVSPTIFLGFERGRFNCLFERELIDGPNNRRHSCQKCGQLAFVSHSKRNIVYINAGIFNFSERFSREQLESLSTLHARGIQDTPFVAHVWCKSDVDFEPDYTHYFDNEIPFYCDDLCISRRGTFNGIRLSADEVKCLREKGSTSGKRDLRGPTIGRDGRQWTNAELKRVFNAAKFNRLDELKVFVKMGAPVDCTPYGSQSPAYIAAFYGKLNSLKYLTEANADLNKIEKDGFTPSHAASSEGHVDCLRWLHENGGSLHLATTTGQTCLSLARRANRKECIRFFESILPVNQWSTTELKKVFDAAKSGRLEELKEYLDSGAPLDCTPYGSQSPTYIACFYGREHCLVFLAERGANLDKTEKDGFTPAHAAASEGHVACLERLHRLGADLSYTTTSGQTCYSLAARAEKMNVVRWLKANVFTNMF